MATPKRTPYQGQGLTELDTCLGSLACALRDHIRPGVGLMDPMNGAVTPEDHYGQTSAALALALLDGKDSASWRHPLAAWQALPQVRTGHAPFNRFLLNLLADHLASDHQSAADIHTIHQSAQRCALSRRYPSNNWSLLARLCELQEAAPTQRGPARSKLRSLFDRWMSAAGGFIDYPARPGSPPKGAMPIAYHQKALFVAAVAREFGEQSDWDPYIERLLQWNLQVWDGGGHVGGMGRSSHALFGDACLVASLLLLGANQHSPLATVFDRMFEGILQRWSGQFRADGFLALNPADALIPGNGCDAYMHLSVYNAWTAAIVAWARAHAIQPGRGEASRRSDAPPTPANMPAPAPDILRLGNPNATLALVATQGQPPQAFSRNEVEFRYAGGVPFHLGWKGHVLIPPAARIPRHTLEEAPALAGWTPIFLADGVLFGLTDFELRQTEVLEDAMKITLTGQPRALLRTPATSFTARAIAAVDWRFLDGALGRQAALHRPALRGMTGTVSLTLFLNQPRISYSLELACEGPRSTTYLNPGGHAVTTSPTLERSFHANQPTREIASEVREPQWQEASLPSALPFARGACQPAIEIRSGTYQSELILEWPSEP